MVSIVLAVLDFRLLALDHAFPYLGPPAIGALLSPSLEGSEPN